MNKIIIRGQGRALLLVVAAGAVGLFGCSQKALTFKAGTLVAPEVAESNLFYKRGVLILDIVDRKAKHLLWRGAIMADFDQSWPEERRQERCDAAVGELLSHYPKP